ncbi:hypothetical protein, partial [Tenacibaculum maritimum]|uniref:hypothetical protein n=1 Tax=Tenacibaculum maritimum TaxID=107401 RepID=UPI0038763FE7
KTSPVTWSILTNSFLPNLPKPTIVFYNVASIFCNDLKVAEVIQTNKSYSILIEQKSIILLQI